MRFGRERLTNRLKEALNGSISMVPRVWHDTESLCPAVPACAHDSLVDVICDVPRLSHSKTQRADHRCDCDLLHWAGLQCNISFNLNCSVMLHTETGPVTIIQEYMSNEPDFIFKESASLASTPRPQNNKPTMSCTLRLWSRLIELTCTGWVDLLPFKRIWLQ